MIRVYFRLRRKDEVFEGSLQEVVDFLHCPNRKIYEAYNMRKPYKGWNIEKKINDYDLYINGAFIDSDTSIVRLLRRHNMFYTTYGRCVDEEKNGVLIIKRSHYE